MCSIPQVAPPILGRGLAGGAGAPARRPVRGLPLPRLDLRVLRAQPGGPSGVRVHPRQALHAILDRPSTQCMRGA